MKKFDFNPITPRDLLIATVSLTLISLLLSVILFVLSDNDINNVINIVLIIALYELISSHLKDITKVFVALFKCAWNRFVDIWNKN